MRKILLVLFAAIVAMAANAEVKNYVEVLYFHGKKRCVTCIAVGDESKAVVTQDLAKLAKAGKVRFKEVDISTPEGEKLAKKYKVSWSSLYVNGWKNGKETRNDMTAFGFSNARNNPKAFKDGLKDKIKSLLK